MQIMCSPNNQNQSLTNEYSPNNKCNVGNTNNHRVTRSIYLKMRHYLQVSNSGTAESKMYIFTYFYVVEFFHCKLNNPNRLTI